MYYDFTIIIRYVLGINETICIIVTTDENSQDSRRTVVAAERSQRGEQICR